MLTIDLNCDMGEGYDSDALILPYITSVNIACGYHAGDLDTMQRTVEMALQHGVAIGAHPSYPDRENFGRKDILHTLISIDDLEDIVHEQIESLQEICAKAGGRLHHVKPHGALYNRAAWDEQVAHRICSAIQKVDASLLVYGLSGSITAHCAAEFGLQYVHEAFADRSYQPDASLTPRTQANAMIEDTGESLRQVLMMIKEGRVRVVTGDLIPIKCETICIHGDSAHAVEFARAIHTSLKENHITLKPHAKSEQW